MKKYEMKCPPGDEKRVLITKEFIKRNKLRIDISAAKKAADNSEDFLGFEREVAVNFLPFKEGKQYYKKDYITKVEEGTIKYVYVEDVAEGAQDFLDYMVFAWMKALNKRGISSLRSINKLSTWMKILSRPDIAKILEDNLLYASYGRPALKKACELLGIKYPEYL